MKYLVTGGAGFIGTNLCEQLVNNHHQVSVIDNLSVSDVNVSYLKSIGVEIIEKDIIHFDDIKTHFIEADVVVHLAAMNRAQRSIDDPIQANEVNVTGTLNCLEAAKLAGVKRFVNISSSSVYAAQENILLKEDMDLQPLHPYGVGKLTGEHYARIYKDIYGLDTVTLRFFSVYGPRQLGSIDKAGVVAKFIHLAHQGIPLEIYGSGDQKRNFSYVSDVVDCVVKASEITSVSGEIINIANPEEISVNSLLKVVEKVVGRELTCKNLPALAGDPFSNPANTKKCVKLLGIEPTMTFEKGIQMTYDWYLKNHKL